MSRMVCEDEEISPLMRNFIRHFDSLTPEERKQEYNELEEFNNVGPKIITDNNMIEFKQKLIQISYAEEVEDYLNDGWHITQISASDDGTCYVLLERESSTNKDDMICE